jgi:hypothetical protein
MRHSRGPGLVKRGMDEESGCVGWTRHVSSNSRARLVDKYQIGRFDEGEMKSETIDDKC